MEQPLNDHTQRAVQKGQKKRTLMGPFFSCGGRTRTYGLRVMSPTSYHLLHPAEAQYKGPQAVNPLPQKKSCGEVFPNIIRACLD